MEQNSIHAATNDPIGGWFQHQGLGRVSWSLLAAAWPAADATGSDRSAACKAHQAQVALVAVAAILLLGIRLELIGQTRPLKNGITWTRSHERSNFLIWAITQ
jgi:hypothetical protein